VKAEDRILVDERMANAEIIVSETRQAPLTVSNAALCLAAAVAFTIGNQMTN